MPDAPVKYRCEHRTADVLQQVLRHTSILSIVGLLILTPCAVYKPIACTHTFLIEFSCLSTV